MMITLPKPVGDSSKFRGELPTAVLYYVLVECCPDKVAAFCRMLVCCVIYCLSSSIDGRNAQLTCMVWSSIVFVLILRSLKSLIRMQRSIADENVEKI